MGEKFFSPKSLARVANAVEWEDRVQVYTDGTTNHSCYIEALAILWERWIREYSLSDFLDMLVDAWRGDFAEGFKRVAEEIPAKLEQLLGFYRGLWYGANPDWKGPIPPIRGTEGQLADWLATHRMASAPDLIDATATIEDSLRRLRTRIRDLGVTLKEEDDYAASLSQKGQV